MNHNMTRKLRFQLPRRGVRAVAASLLAVCLVVNAVSFAGVGNIGSRALANGPQSVVDIAVVPSSKTVWENAVFTLDIYVYPHGQEVDTVDALMTFDPDHLEVQSITGDPSGLDVEMKNEFDNEAGTLEHGRATWSSPYPDNDFRLCSIELRAKDPTPGTMLAFTDRTDATEPTLGASVLRDTTDGTVKIQETVRPVGGVTYPEGPGWALAPWVGLIALAGLILGAVGMIFRRCMG